jgi:hypothetical protein
VLRKQLQGGIASQDITLLSLSSEASYNCSFDSCADNRITARRLSSDLY